MNTNPGGWGQRAMSAIVLILVIAFAAHWAYALLAPLLPMAFALVGVGVVASFLFHRRR